MRARAMRRKMILAIFLRNHRLLHFRIAIDSREPLVEPLIAEGYSRVVESEQMQHRGMQVPHLDGILRDVVAESIRRAMRKPAPDSTAREPDGEGILVMIAAAGLRLLAALQHRGAAEFSTPDH